MVKMKQTYIIIVFCILNMMLFSCKKKVVEVVEDTYTNGAPRLVRTYEKGENGEKKGLLSEKAFYPEKNKIQLEGTYKNDKRNGTWTFYYENGNKWSEAEYKDGLNNGKSVTWFENGKKRYEGYYKDGKQTGKWKFWDEQGKFVKEISY